MSHEQKLVISAKSVYDLFGRVLAQVTKISQTTIVYVCGLDVPRVSGVTVHNHEHSFPVRACYLGNVTVQQFMAVTYYNVPEVISGDFIACVWG